MGTQDLDEEEFRKGIRVCNGMSFAMFVVGMAYAWLFFFLDMGWLAFFGFILAPIYSFSLLLKHLGGCRYIFICFSDGASIWDSLRLFLYHHHVFFNDSVSGFGSGFSEY